MDNAGISVIIAVYNAAELLESCLESIAAQSRRDFEVICVDDCSTDGSGEILRRFAESDPRFEVLTNAVRRGGGASRNLAMRRASGKFVYFMDPDDRLHPRMLECTTYFAERFAADVVSFWYSENEEFPPGARLSAEPGELPYRMESRPFFRMGRSGRYRINYNYWTKLYRRSSLTGVEFIEGTAENPHVLSDFHHSALALFQMHRCVMLREPLYSYTIRSGSETHQRIGVRQVENYRIAVNDLADRLEVDRHPAVRRHLRDYAVSSVVRGQLRRLERLRTVDPDAAVAVRAAYRDELADFHRRGLLGGPGLTLRHLGEWMHVYRLLRS